MTTNTSLPLDVIVSCVCECLKMPEGNDAGNNSKQIINNLLGIEKAIGEGKNLP